MNKERLEKFIDETLNAPYFSSLYDIDMWREDKEELIRDLEVLEFIKKHYEMNGFNELIPIYLDNDDGEKFNELERWLNNER